MSLLEGSSTIDVGLIGCGKRALWYGALFGNIDQNVYARLDPGAYHHMTYYMHVDLQVDRVKGIRLAKVYDRDPESARILASAFKRKVEVCENLAEVSQGVDVVFIASDSGDGRNHAALAQPGLTAGIPTFVDRPLASTVLDARAMVSLARRKGVPLLSCSHLRLLPRAARFKARFAEVGPLDQGYIQGSGSNPAHLADGIELALFLFGDEFNQRAHAVQSMGTAPLEVILLSFARPTSDRSLHVCINNRQTTAGSPVFWAKAVS